MSDSQVPQLQSSPNGSSPPAPLMLTIAQNGDKVVLQVVSTLYLDSSTARNVAAQLAAAADRASSAILVAGQMPDFKMDVKR